MKICFVVHNVNIQNGGGRFARDFILSFKDSDAHFEVVVFEPPVARPPFPCTVLRPGWWRVFQNIYKIRKVAKRCDVVHSFDFFPNAFLASVALLGTGKKHIITAIGTGSVSPLYLPVVSLLVSKTVTSATAVFAISTHTAEKIQEKIPELKIAIIPPFLDSTWGRVCHTPNTAFVDRTDTFRPFILSVISRIKPRKGCLQNIRTFAAAQKRIPELQYVMVATPDGTPYSDAVVAEVARLGLTDTVHFVGGITDDELCWLYAHAGVHLMLSTYDVQHRDVEGFGLVYIEAARHGLWSIGTYDSGARDAIAEGESGYVLNGENEGILIERAADALVRVLQASTHESMAETAKKFANSFTPQASVEAYTRVYQSALRER